MVEPVAGWRLGFPPWRPPAKAPAPAAVAIHVPQPAKSERSQSWLAQRVFAAWSERVRYETRPWLSLLPLLDEVLIAGGEQGKALAPWLLSREAAAFKKCHAGELDLPEVLRDESAPARAPDRR